MISTHLQIHIFNLTFTVSDCIDEIGCQHIMCDEIDPWFAINLESSQRFTHLVLVNRVDEYCKYSSDSITMSL